MKESESQGDWKEYSEKVRRYIEKLQEQESKEMYEAVKYLLWEDGDVNKEKKDLLVGTESMMGKIIEDAIKRERELLKQRLVVTIPPSTNASISQFGPVSSVNVANQIMIPRKAKELPSFDGVEPEPWSFARTLKNEWERVKDVSLFHQLLPDMVVGNAAAWLNTVQGLVSLSDIMESFIETFVGLSREELYASLFTVPQSDGEGELAFLETLMLRADIINVALNLVGVQQLAETQVLVAFKSGVEDQTTIPLLVHIFNPLVSSR